jgi:hypothetical protein
MSTNNQPKQSPLTLPGVKQIMKDAAKQLFVDVNVFVIEQRIGYNIANSKLHSGGYITQFESDYRDIFTSRVEALVSYLQQFKLNSPTFLNNPEADIASHQTFEGKAGAFNTIAAWILEQYVTL